MRSARRFRHLVRHSLLALTTGAALVFSFAAAAQNAGSVQELAGQAFAGTSAARRSLEPQAAILLARSFPNALEGLGASRSAANLRRHGLEADVERCARENALGVVPRYVRRVGPAAEVKAD